MDLSNLAIRDFFKRIDQEDKRQAFFEKQKQLSLSNGPIPTTPETEPEPRTRRKKRTVRFASAESGEEQQGEEKGAENRNEEKEIHVEADQKTGESLEQNEAIHDAEESRSGDAVMEKNSPYGQSNGVDHGKPKKRKYTKRSARVPESVEQPQPAALIMEKEKAKRMKQIAEDFMQQMGLRTNKPAEKKMAAVSSRVETPDPIVAMTKSLAKPRKKRSRIEDDDPNVPIGSKKALRWQERQRKIEIIQGYLRSKMFQPLLKEQGYAIPIASVVALTNLELDQLLTNMRSCLTGDSNGDFYLRIVKSGLEQFEKVLLKWDYPAPNLADITCNSDNVKRYMEQIRIENAMKPLPPLLMILLTIGTNVMALHGVFERGKVVQEMLDSQQGQAHNRISVPSAPAPVTETSQLVTSVASSTPIQIAEVPVQMHELIQKNNPPQEAVPQPVTNVEMEPISASPIGAVGGGEEEEEEEKQ